MIQAPNTGPDKEPVSELLETIERWKSTFKCATVNVVLDDVEGHGREVTLCRIHFSSAEPAEEQNVLHNYGPLTFIRKALSVEEGRKLITAILSEGILALEGLDETQVQVQPKPLGHLSSRFKYPVRTGWPTHIMMANLSSRRKLPDFLPFVYDLPYFPTPSAAMTHYLQLGDTMIQPGDLQIVVPDYRARLRQLHIDGESISAEVECGTSKEEGVKVKIHASSGGRVASSTNLDVVNGKAAYILGFEPESVTALLVSVEDRKPIDQFILSLQSPFGNEDVVIDSIEENLLRIIPRGESATVEFKQTLDESRSREYLETIVAFANTRGGTILIGVDDKCRVTGWKEDIGKLTSQVAELCDPPIVFEVKTDIMLEGKPVTAISVPEGKNKPYLLKDRGIFVRRGASDRQVTRSELDELYNKSGRGAFPGLVYGFGPKW